MSDPHRALGNLRRDNLGRRILAKLLKQLAVDRTGWRQFPILLVVHDGGVNRRARDTIEQSRVEAEGT